MIFNSKTPTTGMVLKDDVKVVTVTYGNSVALYDVTTFDLLRTHSLPCVVNSASLHLDQVLFSSLIVHILCQPGFKNRNIVEVRVTYTQYV